MKHIILRYLEYRKDDIQAKEVQQVVADRNFSKLTIMRLRQAARATQKEKQLIKRANSFYENMLKYRHFRAIYTFSKMENKKLESIAKVNSYIKSKYKHKVLSFLKINMVTLKTKDGHLRKALKFQMFRHNHFITKQAFRILRTWHKAYLQRKSQIKTKIRLFRLRNFFEKLL